MSEPLNVTLPVIYDMQMNTLQVGVDRPNSPHSTIWNIINNLIKRFVDINGTVSYCNMSF